LLRTVIDNVEKDIADSPTNECRSESVNFSISGAVSQRESQAEAEHLHPAILKIGKAFSPNKTVWYALQEWLAPEELASCHIARYVQVAGLAAQHVDIKQRLGVTPEKLYACDDVVTHCEAVTKEGQCNGFVL
uniref:Ras-GEF domain-containing protein n=1 Tax=Nippostrongylus brasiliensis TaxID=27835 RepID=A0A0N4YWG2_NIPBR